MYQGDGDHIQCDEFEPNYDVRDIERENDNYRADYLRSQLGPLGWLISWTEETPNWRARISLRDSDTFEGVAPTKRGAFIEAFSAYMDSAPHDISFPAKVETHDSLWGKW